MENSLPRNLRSDAFFCASHRFPAAQAGPNCPTYLLEIWEKRFHFYLDASGIMKLN